MAEVKADLKKAAERRKAPLDTPTDLGSNAVRDISGAMNELLADVFGLYLKTKNFHWHMSGPHFRDYHLMLDEQSDQIFAMTDPIAERVRKIGGTTLRSIGQIAQAAAHQGQRRRICRSARHAGRAARRQQGSGRPHALGPWRCDEHDDVATASLIEVWIDETERRPWFLFESSRNEITGH